MRLCFQQSRLTVTYDPNSIKANSRKLFGSRVIKYVTRSSLPTSFYSHFNISQQKNIRKHESLHYLKRELRSWQEVLSVVYVLVYPIHHMADTQCLVKTKRKPFVKFCHPKAMRTKYGG